MPQPSRRRRRSSDIVDLTIAGRNVRHKSVVHTEIRNAKHHAIQQTNQFVLELASITLQRPNESSLVSQIAFASLLVAHATECWIKEIAAPRILHEKFHV
ncbi:hypothetical protein WJX77_006908 [Trebouxia sp. C0004]